MRIGRRARPRGRGRARSFGGSAHVVRRDRARRRVNARNTIAARCKARRGRSRPRSSCACARATHRCGDGRAGRGERVVAGERAVHLERVVVRVVPRGRGAAPGARGRKALARRPRLRGSLRRVSWRSADGGRVDGRGARGARRAPRRRAASVRGVSRGGRRCARVALPSERVSHERGAAAERAVRVSSVGALAAARCERARRRSRALCARLCARGRFCGARGA